MKCVGSRYEVEWVGEFEPTFGKAAFEIALLIADISDDEIAALLYLLALPAFEWHERWIHRPKFRWLNRC